MHPRVLGARRRALLSATMLGGAMLFAALTAVPARADGGARGGGYGFVINGAGLSNSNSGNVVPGGGNILAGAGGAGGASTNGGGGFGGDGGVGVQFSSSATNASLTNNSNIQGGAGGNA